jgi:peptidoglycan/LPS O-acetylase OafA/YrhL
MLSIAAILFAVAALGGLLLAFNHFTGRARPWPLAIIHGAVAASAFVVFLLAVVQGGAASPKVYWSLGLFAAAALGGLLLFSFHIRNKPLASPVVVIHGGAAVAAFLLLLLVLKG